MFAAVRCIFPVAVLPLEFLDVAVVAGNNVGGWMVIFMAVNPNAPTGGRLA